MLEIWATFAFLLIRQMIKKDHFPINSLTQARNALSQVAKYTKVPSWYNGSLKGLVETVKKKVHGKYPSIKSEKRS